MTKQELYDWWFDSFGACNCGDPAFAAELLRDVLQILSGRDFGLTPEEWEKTTTLLHDKLPTDGVFWTYLYWLSHLDLEEHGGCTPGWLTGHGDAVLAALQEFGTDPNKWCV